MLSLPRMSPARLAHPMLVNPKPLAGTILTMKVIAAMSLLISLGQGALADDLSTPTPSPTPVYLRHFARPGSVRRMEQLDRRRALDADSRSRAATRAQTKADRLASARAEADAKAAARDRERAQRKVDTESRLETAKATPRATSDLMKRMGFSEQDIAAQKALEEPAKPGANPNASPAKTAPEKPANASPAPRPGE